MKTLVGICIPLLALIVACNTTQPHSSATTSPPPGGPPAIGEGQAVVRVNGMSCPNCANYIGYELKKINGVHDVKFDLGKGTVTALYSGRPPTETQLKKAVTDSGFTYVATEPTPALAGKTCTACTCGDCKCGKGGHCKSDCVCG